MYITCQRAACDIAFKAVLKSMSSQMDSLSLSVGFMCDKMQFLHIDVDNSNLPALTLPWF